MSVASTTTLPPALTVPRPVVKLIHASEALLTILLVNTALAAFPVAFHKADAVELAALLIVEFNCALFAALTVISPAPVTVVFSRYAFTLDGFSVPSAVPNSASSVAKRMFCASQPSVLNARVTPTAVFPVVVELLMLESIPELFRASTVTSPPSRITSLLVIEASDELMTKFVAIVAFTASDTPVPKALPPLETTFPLIFANRSDSSCALTVTSPVVTETSASVTKLFTPLRRSLRTTWPPPERESELVRFPISGKYLTSAFSSSAATCSQLPLL